MGRKRTTRDDRARGRSGSPAPASLRALWWLPAVTALVTILAFAPALQNGFTGWDDPAYVTENALIRDLSPGGLGVIFRTFVEGNYHPLTMASLAVDYHFWRLNPKGYHVTNLALHVLCTWAVLWLVHLLTGSAAMSAIAALFFGIHPLHVESVAWVSERKDVLYTLFYLCACISYVLWVRGRRAKAGYYAGALGFFVLSLLSKGMAATLPIALLLIDGYLEGVAGLKRRLVEKAPFFLLAAGFGVLAIVAQRATGAIEKLTLYPFHERALFASYAVAAYLSRALAPLKLSAFYPYPQKAGGLLPILFYVAPILLCFVAAAVYWSWRHTRGVAFGALFFLLNVALVLQFIPLGSAMMADRYTYLSYFGLGFILAEVYRRAAEGRRAKAQWPRLAAGAALVLFGLGLFAATRARCEVWRDNLTLWNDVIRKHPGVGLAYVSRALTYEARGEHDLALADLDRALALNRNDSMALCNRGIVLVGQNRLDQAIADLDRSIALDGTRIEAWHNRGVAHARRGSYDAAVSDFTRAIELKPAFPPAYLNRANAFYLSRRFDRALRDYDSYIGLEPRSAEAYYGRGLARAALGDAADAIGDYARAIEINPSFGAAYAERSRGYAALNRHDDALRDALRARELGQEIEESYLLRLRGARAP